MTCALCPRNCSAPRGQGYCGMPETAVVARAALHHWEEPPISGTRGSGTIFFSGCALDCLFCQNDVISHQKKGKEITVERLRALCLNLIDQGAHNINLVNPTHYAHQVLALLKEPLPVPVVWNTGGYDKVDTLRKLEGKIDIYLPDLKYLDSAVAKNYSGAADYPQVATAAITEMVRQVGAYQLEDGLLKRGVIIRHLVLPGQLSGAKAVMDWVADAFPPDTVLFSLMSQYTPYGRALDHPILNRPLRHSEARNALAYMENLGLQGFGQAETAADTSYIPPFDFTGLE